MNQKRTRQNYTKEFKDDAVKLVIEQGYNTSEVGRRLGINQTNVSRWVHEYRQENEPSVNGGATRSELEADQAAA